MHFCKELYIISMKTVWPTTVFSSLSKLNEYNSGEKLTLFNYGEDELNQLSCFEVELCSILMNTFLKFFSAKTVYDFERRWSLTHCKKVSTDKKIEDFYGEERV